MLLISKPYERIHKASILDWISNLVSSFFVFFFFFEGLWSWYTQRKKIYKLIFHVHCYYVIYSFPPFYIFYFLLQTFSFCLLDYVYMYKCLLDFEASCEGELLNEMSSTPNKRTKEKHEEFIYKRYTLPS